MTVRSIYQKISFGLFLVVFFLVSIGTNAFATHTEEVSGVYQTILKRNADAMGLQYWSGLRTNKQISLSEMYVAFLLCDEYAQLNSARDRDALIQSFYSLFLKRKASDYEIGLWGNYSIQNVARKFVAWAFQNGWVAPIPSDILGCIEGDAVPAIEAFVASTKDSAYLSNCEYQLKTRLSIKAKQSFTFSSVAEKARLKADKYNTDGPLLHITLSNKLSLSNLIIDGNIQERRAAYNNYWNTLSLQNADSRNMQANAIIDNCNGCSLSKLESINAVGASGLIIWGKNCTIDSCIFQNNGYGLNQSPLFGEWSDGVTIVSGEGFVVTNNYFIDNSDVGLVFANLASGKVSRNTFLQENNWIFAAMGVTNFDNNALNNNTGAIVANNTINCSNGMCGIGLSLGPYLWSTKDYTGGVLNPIYGGTFQYNTISGARQGIAIMGAKNTTLTNNTITNSGNWQLPTKYITSALADDLHTHCNDITDLFNAVPLDDGKK